MADGELRMCSGGPFNYLHLWIPGLPFNTLEFSIGEFKGYYTSKAQNSSILHSTKKLYWVSTL